MTVTTKGGKAAKKTRKKKEPEKKIDTRAVIEAVGNLLEAAELMSRSIAHVKACANVVNLELNLGLDGMGMTAYEAQHYTRPQAPLKKGAVPKPANGAAFTAEELGNPGVFTRQVLSSILTSLGGDHKGKMPPALRTAIMEAQGGRVELGDCDFTGDENVPIKKLEVGGETYSFGPKVDELIRGKSDYGQHKILLQLLDGEIEV